MACIKIQFPRLGLTTSTWVADEYWLELSTQQKTALIHRYIKNNYPAHLYESLNDKRSTAPNFKWEEI